MTKYRTYKTETAALRRKEALRAQYPAEIFVVLPDPDFSFRFVIAIFCEPDRWAFCS